MYFIQQCFICRPSDSTVSEDAGIEPRTAATLALTDRHSDHSARSHPLVNCTPPTFSVPERARGAGEREEKSAAAYSQTLPPPVEKPAETLRLASAS